MKTLQKFTAVHAASHNHFNQDRHLISRDDYKDRPALAVSAGEKLPLD
jgi:putative transposase